jgi:hypothetical protein
MKSSKKGCCYFVLLLGFVVFSSCNVALDLKLRIPEDRNTDILLQFPQGTLTEKDKNALAALIKWGELGDPLDYPEKLKFIAIQHNSKITDADIEFLKHFPNLEELYIVKCPKITDEGMDILEYLSRLKYLSLKGTNVTEASVERIAKLTDLEDVALGVSAYVHDGGGIRWNEQLFQFGNKTLEILKDSNLKSIWLMSPTLIDDEGLKYLESMKNLETFNLLTTNVTPKGIDWLHNYLKKNGNKLSYVDISVGDYSKPYEENSSKLEIIRENGKQITWSHEIESVL